MTVKKTLSLKRPAKKPAAPPPADGGDEPETLATAAAPASGAATIADRFKLDAPPPVKAAGSGTGTKVAVIAGLIALVVAGVLTYTLYAHWEFLKGA